MEDISRILRIGYYTSHLHEGYMSDIKDIMTLKSEVIGKLLLWTYFMDQGVFFAFSNEGNESFILPEYPPSFQMKPNSPAPTH